MRPYLFGPNRRIRDGFINIYERVTTGEQHIGSVHHTWERAVRAGHLADSHLLRLKYRIRVIAKKGQP